MTRRSSGDEVEAARARKPATVDDLPLFSSEPAPAEQPAHLVPVRAHLRRVPGEAPPSGKELRDSALAAHEADEAKRTALEYVREKLADLYRERAAASRWTREEPFVTSDDADRIWAEWPHFPKALRELPSANWKGATFNPSMWQKTGRYVRSTRARMNATDMACWRLRDVAQERAS